MSSGAVLVVLSALAAAVPGVEGAGNRLTYLDAPCDPYYVGRDSARLVTPQWIGQPGVDAVIVLSCDDLREPQKHETYLRPILDRLKQLRGRASVSLMANRLPPGDPIVARWLAEGVSIEAHTVKHSCPCLQAGSLAAAKADFDACIDTLAETLPKPPVAFRMPCCDSMNSVSPRFFSEIFNPVTPGGRFLQVDSSVFLLLTAGDAAVPRQLALDPDGTERFRKYVPTSRGYVNYVEDYPYPYVIGRLAWEIPALMPSDWDAQDRQGKAAEKTLEDFKAAADIAVVKQGIFAICFHPYDWLANSQLVALVDYVDKTYGRRVEFLSFAEVNARLTGNLLGGTPLRAAAGGDNGVRLLDANRDGLLDVLIGNREKQVTRIWNPQQLRWTEVPLPCPMVVEGDSGERLEAGARFGVLKADGQASLLLRNEKDAGLWHFTGDQWVADPQGLAGLDDGGPVRTVLNRRDRGARLRDLDGDGVCELLVANEVQNAAFAYGGPGRPWKRLPFGLPDGVRIVDARGRDAGLRFADINGDGCADLVFSNAERYSADLFEGIQEGWSRRLFAGVRGAGETQPLPPIVRADGTNNGVWFKDRKMWVQNEDTGKQLPGEVDQRSFEADFLGDMKESR